MGLTIRRLSWSAVEILDFVEATLRESRGVWSFGVPGAMAWVSRERDEPLEICREEDAVVAVMPRAALRITANRATRALAWREAADRPERIVLALPRSRLGEPGPASVTALGPDADALLPGEAEAPRVDIGLGRAEARFTLRSRDAALIDAAGRAGGMPWADRVDAMEAAGGARVVETPLGRAEIAARAEERAVPGPRATIEPASITEGHATPPGLGLPAAYALGCLFEPAA
jgi:hypothetical protein